MKKNIESEEKLSMTRELKFKELQDKIDEEEADRIVEEAIQKSKKKNSKKTVTSELEKEIDEILEVETKKGRKGKKVKVENIDEELDDLLEDKKEVKEPVKEEKEVKITKVNGDDDLYLTSSFKPLKSRMKVSKVFKFLFKLIFTLALLAAFVYFIIFPIYKMVYSSKPKVIFDHSLDYVQEQFNAFIDTNIELDEEVFSLEAVLDIDSNIKDMEVITDNKFIFTIGTDLKNKRYEEGIYVENKDNVRHGFTYIEQGTTMYTNFTTTDIFLNEGEVEEGEESFKIEEEDATLVTNEDYKYYIDKWVSTLKEVINEEDLKSSKEELIIDGFNASVVRNSLELDKDGIIKLGKDISEILLKDKKFLEIDAVINDMTIEEVKESYKVNEDLDKDETLSFNIYTNKGNKFVGFDIEENGFRNIYFYKYDNKFEAHFNLSEDEECLTGGDCVEGARQVIDLIGTTRNNITKVDIFLNDEDIGSLEINELSFEKVDFEYNIILQDIRYEGDLYFEFDKENKKYEFGASVEFNDQYIKASMSMTFDGMKDIGYIDESKIVDYTDKLSDKQVKEFYDITSKLNMYDSYNMFVETLDTINTLLYPDDTESEGDATI